jgi:hypothetical protein
MGFRKLIISVYIAFMYYQKNEEEITSKKEASEDAWEELKEGAENVWTELRNTFDDVVSKFK